MYKTGKSKSQRIQTGKGWCTLPKSAFRFTQSKEMRREEEGRRGSIKPTRFTIRIRGTETRVRVGEEEVKSSFAKTLHPAEKNIFNFK